MSRLRRDGKSETMKKKQKLIYLVVARTNLDDLPLLLTEDLECALQYARTAPVGDVNKCADLCDVDLAGLVNTAIIPFDIETMRPLGLHIVAQFGDDDKLQEPTMFKRLPAEKKTKKKWSAVKK